jgi:hypothetical protein
MKQTKTKSVDARRLAETEMDDDADVKSFIFFLSLSYLLIFARAHAHAQNAPVVPLCFRGRVCVRDVCLSLSLSFSLPSKRERHRTNSKQFRVYKKCIQTLNYFWILSLPQKARCAG